MRKGFGSEQIKSFNDLRTDLKVGSQVRLRLLNNEYESEDQLWVDCPDGKRRPVVPPPIEVAQLIYMANGQPLSSLYPARTAYRIEVWNHTSGRAEFLEGPPMLFEQVNALATSTDWGDPRYYDVVIATTKQGEYKRYQVQPCPKANLDPQVIAIMQEQLPEVLKQMAFGTNTPEEVAAIIGGTYAPGGASFGGHAAAPPSAPAFPQSGMGFPQGGAGFPAPAAPQPFPGAASPGVPAPAAPPVNPFPAAPATGMGFPGAAPPAAPGVGFPGAGGFNPMAGQ